MPPTGDGARFLAPMLVATDFAATVRFYSRVLGADVRGERTYAEVRTDHSLLSIFDAEFFRRTAEVDVPRTAVGVAPAHTLLSFEVDDLNEAFERLAGSGAAFLSTPSDRLPLGRPYATLRDPDGRVVVLLGPRRSPT